MMNNNKEDLTDATMQVLQGNLKDKSSNGSEPKRRLKKLVEDYAADNNYIEIFRIIIDIILSTTDDAELLGVLNDLHNNTDKSTTNV